MTWARSAQEKEMKSAQGRIPTLGIIGIWVQIFSWVGAVLCLVGCWGASLTPTHQILEAHAPVTTTKNSPDVAQCSHRDRVAPLRTPWTKYIGWIQRFLCLGVGVSSTAHVGAQLLSHVWLSVTSWAVAHQALSMGFSRQEYWSGLHLSLKHKICPFPRIPWCSVAKTPYS